MRKASSNLGWAGGVHPSREAGSQVKRPCVQLSVPEERVHARSSSGLGDAREGDGQSEPTFQLRSGQEVGMGGVLRSSSICLEEGLAWDIEVGRCKLTEI